MLLSFSLMRIRKYVNLKIAVSHSAMSVVSPKIKPTCEKRRAKIILEKHNYNLQALISGGLGLQWLEVWLEFPSRDWGWGMVMRKPNPSHKTSGQWQRPWLFDFREKNSHKDRNRETSKVLREKEYITCGQSHKQTQRERERERNPHPLGSLNHLHGTSVPGFL